jgi:hypothetical protein
VNRLLCPRSGVACQAGKGQDGGLAVSRGPADVCDDHLGYIGAVCGSGALPRAGGRHLRSGEFWLTWQCFGRWLFNEASVICAPNRLLSEKALDSAQGCGLVHSEVVEFGEGFSKSRCSFYDRKVTLGVAFCLPESYFRHLGNHKEACLLASLVVSGKSIELEGV